MNTPKTCSVVGGGPAGLMAAEILANAGCHVTVFDRMPSFGRKLLMAGIGGLNLTHSEDQSRFLTRYRGLPLTSIIEAFGPADLRAWAEELGQETFVGSSGRVFPRAFKASPLLRAWMQRLAGQGVDFRTRHRWTGWQGDRLGFETPDGEITVASDITILALGGASWPRLGSDGRWPAELAKDAAPFEPSNCGFHIGWDAHVGARFAGTPLKPICLSFGGATVQGEAVVTTSGIEGGAVYALSPLLRDAISAEGSAVLSVDLKPGMSLPQIREKLAHPRKGDSLANRLRKALRLPPVAVAVLREGVPDIGSGAEELAAAIKAVPLTLIAPTGLDRAISSAGGITAAQVDEHLMLRDHPGVFVAGEMLDWEAPTGGYLLQACFASGRWAAKGALTWSGLSSP